MSQAGDDEEALAEERRLALRRHHAGAPPPGAVVGPAAALGDGAAADPHDVPLPALRSVGAQRGRRRAAGRARSGTQRRGRLAGIRRRRHPTAPMRRCSTRSRPGVGERSADDDVPAYVVATDATLVAIAERRPRSGARAAGRAGHRARQGREVRCRDPRHRWTADGLSGVPASPWHGGAPAPCASPRRIELRPAERAAGPAPRCGRRARRSGRSPSRRLLGPRGDRRQPPSGGRRPASRVMAVTSFLSMRWAAVTSGPSSSVLPAIVWAT